MTDLSFEECVDVIRDKVLSNNYDEEYTQTLNMMSVMWDQEKATAINQAVTPMHVRPVPDGFVYILMRANPPKYLIVSRDQMGSVYYA